jgi:hypothetical protein
MEQYERGAGGRQQRAGMGMKGLRKPGNYQGNERKSQHNPILHDNFEVFVEIAVGGQ